MKEDKIDAKRREQVARYDQDLKERARKLAINPENFDTEEQLKLAIERKENE